MSHLCLVLCLEEMCAKPSLNNLITSAACHWDPALSFKIVHFINGNSIHFIKGNHYQLDMGIEVDFFFLLHILNFFTEFHFTVVNLTPD